MPAQSSGAMRVTSASLAGCAFAASNASSKAHSKAASSAMAGKPA
jgi:hypothetical protein